MIARNVPHWELATLAASKSVVVRISHTWPNITEAPEILFTSQT